MKELLKYNIRKGKDILFEFEFNRVEENNYNIKYNLYFDKVEKHFKSNEMGTIAKGYLARILSGFQNEFKIKPLNEKLGFDFSVDVSFDGNIDETLFIDRFIDYKVALENILKKLKIVLTRENINAIIEWYENNDKSVEHMIVLDSKTNNIYVVNSNIDTQDSTTLGIYLTDRDILEIERMSRPIIIHNHQNNLTFSREDYVVYDKLKEIIKKKFLFMVYNVSDYSLKEITTYTVFA